MSEPCSDTHTARSNVVIRGIMENKSTGVDENNVRIERLNVVIRGTMEIGGRDGENTSDLSAEGDAGYVLVSLDA